MTGRRSIFATAALVAALLGTGLAPTRAGAQPIPADEARAIAKEAYNYGFPLVDSYRILCSYFVDKSSPEYKAPWNQIYNNARVFTPKDTAMQTSNSDTPYSQLGLDLRTELAPGPERAVHVGPALVLAEGRSAGRELENPAASAGELSGERGRGRR